MTGDEGLQLLETVPNVNLISLFVTKHPEFLLDIIYVTQSDVVRPAGSTQGLCLLLRCRLLDPKLLCFFPSLDLKLPLVIKYPGISLENGSYELDPEIVRHLVVIAVLLLETQPDVLRWFLFIIRHPPEFNLHMVYVTQPEIIRYLGLRLVRRPRRLRPKLVCFFASLGLELLFVIKHPGIALENGIHELEPEIVRHHVVIAVLLMEIQPEVLSAHLSATISTARNSIAQDFSKIAVGSCANVKTDQLNQGGTVESASEAKRRRKPTNLMILARSSPLARAVAPRIRINDGIGPKPPPPGEWLKRTVFITIVCIRYVIQPLIGMAVVHAAYGVGLLPHDPLYRYVLMMLFALPPAMNIGTMAQFVDLPVCCHCAYDVVDDIHVHPVLRLRVTIKKNRICGNIQLTDC
uniref:Uncharacterized protein n=1 Tax=Oryza glumipatula TaxID=40148 RepID=A0A0E0B6B4_9ORYZ